MAYLKDSACAADRNVLFEIKLVFDGDSVIRKLTGSAGDYCLCVRITCVGQFAHDRRKCCDFRTVKSPFLGNEGDQTVIKDLTYILTKLPETEREALVEGIAQLIEQAATDNGVTMP